MVAEVGVANSKEGAVLERSHTFVIEIDRQGAPEQERLRWRWRDSLGDNTAGVAQDLLSFLQKHFRAPAGSTPTTTAPAGERASGDQQDVDLYSVEVHDPARGGWTPLSVSTSSETIPRNCRVRVNIFAKPQATTTRCRQTTTEDPSSSSDGNSCKNLSASLPSGPARRNATFDGTAVPGAATTVDGTPLPEDESSLDPVAPGEMLALPWRRFDKDLGGEGEEGLKICGNRVAIRDVSNSSEGTGLFTWDGAVLLAKYLEHRAVAMRRDFCEQQPCHSTQPSYRHPEGAGHGSSVTVAAGDSADVNINNNSSSGCRSSNGNISSSSCSSSKSVRAAPIRVLELGCGTGLAGLAAAFAFGRRHSGTSGDDNSEVNHPPPPSPCRRRNPLEGENDEGVAQCASPPAQVAVVLTDLEYALTNARANTFLNSSSLEAVGAEVSSIELDWCRPLPRELSDKEAFDLILAADVVWLDDLVTPLVRTLERLTAGWPGGGVDAWSAPLPPAPANGTQEERRNETGLAASFGSGASPQECELGGCAARSGGRPRPPAGRRVLLAYQWRSERTGRALLEELGACFCVREIPAEECHPDYLPSSNLCLLEAVRRQE
ncbi:conserved unknown protein [Ectocarpus siliculosus]|uniref:Uncharacterized protein n=1 Tax=Ectocarpus siliculosus TaxID=2880 RepID=D8LDR8_ECTSI|nr:conserved unknown protein [Ectocarpus siliculosus]|eukprot:CBN78475.1 conserved unknown protein [Ectocarpus siliculosus]